MSDEDTSLLLDRIAELTGRLARAEFALGADGAISADALPDAIAVVVAERDGLRAELADEKCNGQSTEGAYHDARAERDRLRAVGLEMHAERRQLWAFVDLVEVVLHHLGAGTLGDHPERVDELQRAFAQLDASGVMGGEEEGSVTPEEVDNPDWYSDPQGYAELEAERDRLREVVEAAREVLAGLDWTTGGGKKLIPVTALLVLRDGLAVLDGTGVMGGKDELLTTTEAARILGVSRPHLIDKLLDTGVIPHFRTGRDRRIKRIDVEAYNRQRESSAGGATDG